jgi:hypothetical protein
MIKWNDACLQGVLYTTFDILQLQQMTTVFVMKHIKKQQISEDYI